MATTNVILLAIITLSALQVLGHRIQTVNDDIDEAMEKALEVLKHVRNTINDNVEYGIYFVNSTIESLHSSDEKSQEYSRRITSTKADLAYFTLNVDFAMIMAHDSGFEEIYECYEHVFEKLLELQTSSQNISTVCNNHTVGGVLQDAEQILKNISQISQQIDDQADILEKCRKDLKPIDCINNVVDDLNKLSTQIPADIKNDVNKIQEEATKVELKVSECADYIFPNFHDGLINLETEFYKCGS